MSEYQVVNTDNLNGDYPNETFVLQYPTDEQMAIEVAALYNLKYGGIYALRYYKVVELPYELAPGFEP